jgi:hypothetical protein
VAGKRSGGDQHLVPRSNSARCFGNTTKPFTSRPRIASITLSGTRTLAVEHQAQHGLKGLSHAIKAFNIKGLRA